MTEKTYLTASRLRSEKIRIETLRSVLKDTQRIKLVTNATEYIYNRPCCENKSSDTIEHTLAETITAAAIKALEDRLVEIDKEFEEL